jgi:hypothetical protein
MDRKAEPWWAHVIVATTFALPLAAIPFLVVGLPLRWAEVSAAIIFPLAIMFYVFVMRGPVPPSGE